MTKKFIDIDPIMIQTTTEKIHPNFIDCVCEHDTIV